jgi:hypothetical protein
MIMEQKISIPKKTVTYADTLYAYGLAYLMSIAFEKGSNDTTGVFIEDSGSGYQISLPRAFTAEDLKKIPPGPHYRYVSLESNGEQYAGVLNYDAERQREVQFRQARESMVKQHGGRLSKELVEQLNNLRPYRNFSLFKALRSLKAFDAYNGAWLKLASLDKEEFFNLIEAEIRQLVTGKPISGIKKKNNIKISTVQAFNPSAPKGINRLKPDGTQLAGLPQHHSDGFFAEWMRFIGINRGGFAAMFGKKGEHVKIYVISPQKIDAGAISEIRDRFLSGLRGRGSVARDIMSALGVAETLLNYSLEEPGRFSSLLNKRPRDLIKGLHVAFFRSLGQAKGLANLSFIGLPGWFPITGKKDVNDYLAIIEEHKRCLAPLDENKGDELSLLEQYRLFLSSDNLFLFLNFLGLWASHLIRTGQEKDIRKRARQFHRENLRRLIVGMDGKLSQIVEESSGFNNVAAAIRRTTVYAQRYKGEKNAFEIRYGLAQEWKRRAKFKNDFVIALCDFVNGYNAENARYIEKLKKSSHEKPRGKGPFVSQEDLKEVIRLIDEHGSELICMLLLAFGYASAGKKAQDVEDEPDADVVEFDDVEAPDTTEEDDQ